MWFWIALQLAGNLVTVASFGFRDQCVDLDGSTSNINSIYHDQSCIVFDQSKKDIRDKWPNYCTHFTNGNLAVVFTKELLDLLIDLLLRSGIPTTARPYTALIQANKTDEPTGNFILDVNDGNIYQINPRTVMWDGGQPDNYNDDNECQVINYGKYGLNDIDCAGPRTYLCQYPDPNIIEFQHVQKAKNKRMDPSSGFLEFHGMKISVQCALECGIRFLCHSFSFNQQTGHCQLHMIRENFKWNNGTLPSVEDFKIDAPGYVIFEKTGSSRIAVYNKTDDFNFHVVRYGFANSNVHSNMGYKVLYSQLIRIARICNSITDFENRVKELTDTLIINGYKKANIYHTFYKFATIYNALLLKFKLDSKNKIDTFCANTIS